MQQVKVVQASFGFSMQVIQVATHFLYIKQVAFSQMEMNLVQKVLQFYIKLIK